MNRKEKENEKENEKETRYNFHFSDLSDSVHDC
jgi:hypothetical protein